MKFALALFAALALSVAAHADSVVFTNTVVNQSNLTSSLGGVTSTTGEALTSVDGMSITGGLLTFSTSAASSSFSFSCGFNNSYSAGGTFTITGQLFGLSPGSTLLSGTLGSGQTVSECAGTTSYTGNANSVVTFVNPALASGLPANYAGPLQISVNQAFDQFPDLTKITTTTTVSLAASPEPGTSLLLATGFLGLAALVYAKASRTGAPPSIGN